MTTTIPSAQLEAITRLELAADALQKALRAVQHPDLSFTGGAIIAPSGRKHLSEIHSTLHAIEQSIHPSDTSIDEPPTDEVEPPPSLDEFILSDSEHRIVQSVALNLATDLASVFRGARAHLTLHPSFATDPEITNLVLGAALAESSRLGRRIAMLLDAKSAT